MHSTLISMENQPGKIHIYYDGVCNLCSGVMDKIDKSSKAQTFEMNDVTRGQLPPGKSFEQSMRDMHVVDEKGNVYAGAQAVLKIFEQYPHLAWLAPIGRLPGMNFIAAGLYRIVAVTRYWIFGRKQVS